MVQGLSVESYQMTWEVDGGQPVPMWNSYNGYPHKEAAVDLTNWTWRGTGPYLVTFRAKDAQGVEFAQTSVEITVASASQAITSTTAAAAVSTTSSAGSQNTEPPQVRAVATSSTSGTQTTSTSNSTASTTAYAQTPTASTPTAYANDVWWPSNGATLSGTQPFKALLENRDVSTYRMFWQVDKGGLVEMASNYADWPHKEALVDLSGWTWRGKGPYTLNFVSKDLSGNTLAQKQVKIYIGSAQTAVSSAATVSSPAPAPGSNFYVNPNSEAKQQADAWRTSRPVDALQMDKIAAQPEAVWLGGWNQNVANDAANVMKAAAAQNTTPIFVAYNIPNRDCGGYSSGGGTPDGYRSWIRSMAQGIGGRSALVVLEPDSLALTSCLSSSDLNTRYSLLSDAVNVLKNAGARVYLDAGHPGWISPGDMAGRLRSAGLAQADGFALNVSNFTDTAENISYGTQISQAAGGKHFIVDTSRNGLGSNGEWCNPSGRALGSRPTLNTGSSLADAFLWIKAPGESDGWCNGGPSAGAWWADYALGLAQRAAY